MTAIRIVTAPRRLPGETGSAFIDRMLREVSNKGGLRPSPSSRSPRRQSKSPPSPMLTALVVFALVLLPDMTPVIAAMVWGPPASGHPSRVSDTWGPGRRNGSVTAAMAAPSGNSSG